VILIFENKFDICKLTGGDSHFSSWLIIYKKNLNIFKLNIFL